MPEKIYSLPSKFVGLRVCIDLVIQNACDNCFNKHQSQRHISRTNCRLILDPNAGFSVFSVKGYRPKSLFMKVTVIFILH
jgi:hypothetical protein